MTTSAITKVKRHRTRFGVIIPPWKEDNQKHPVTIEFVLTGKIPTKKNNYQIAFNIPFAIGKIKKYFNKFIQDKEQPTISGVKDFLINLLSKEIHPYLYIPPEIKKWEEESKEKIVQQAAYWSQIYASKSLRFPIRKCDLHIRHYWSSLHTRDNSNRLVTLEDLLVSAGIIVDDDYKYIPNIHSSAREYKDELVDHITTISLVCYDW